MAKLAYKAMRCGRCSGTGRFGGYGVCFNCCGAGNKLTPNGKRAAARVEAFIADTFSRDAAGLVVGDTFTDYHTITAIGSVSTSKRRLIWTVTEIEQRADDVQAPLRIVAVARWRGELVTSAWHMRGDAKVRQVVAGADWDRVVAFAAGLPGVEVRA